MRKIFASALVATAMLFTANSTQAQVKFGLKGGLNVTNMSLNEDVFNTENQTGFFIGPTLKFTLPIVGLGIDASALYDQREAKVSGEVGNEQKTIEERSMKSKYVNIPINLRYGVGLGSLANVFMFAGPQFGFNVGDKEQSLVDGKTWQLSSSTFSVNVGAGFTIANHLQLSANYNIACGKTGDVTIGSAISDAVKGGKGRANAWQIGLAYYF